MAYQIMYDREAKKSRSGRWVVRFILTACFFLIFLRMVSSFWPEGRELLQTLLIPGDPEMTLEAAEVFAQELNSGFSLYDAVRNFCAAVSEYAH